MLKLTHPMVVAQNEDFAILVSLSDLGSLDEFPGPQAQVLNKSTQAVGEGMQSAQSMIKFMDPLTSVQPPVPLEEFLTRV